MGILIDLTGGANNPPRTIADASIPAVMRAAPWYFTWTPANASASLPEAFATILVFDEGALNSGLFYDRTGALLAMTDASGATVMSVACTWDAADAVRIELNPVAMTLRVSGANTGNGTHAISGTLAALWPAGNDLRFGSDYGGAFEAVGTWSDVEDDDVATATAPRRRARSSDDVMSAPQRRSLLVAAFGSVPLALIPRRARAISEAAAASAALPRRTLPLAAFGTPPYVALRPRTARVELLRESLTQRAALPQRRSLSLAAVEEVPPVVPPSGVRRPRDRFRGREMRWRG